MSEIGVNEVSYNNLLNLENTIGVQRVYEYWDGKTLSDVRAEMPDPMHVPIDDMRDVQLVEILPQSGSRDNMSSIALGLPFLNGYTPHHYIRAKSLQLLAGPDTPVYLMPNNSTGNTAYSFTPEEKERLAAGDITPLGEIEMRAFNKLYKTHRNVGILSITGYSQGGLTALAMGAVGSDRIFVDTVNADEAPSKKDRGAKQLQKDFLSSGKIGALRGAVNDADIDALSQAMNIPRLSRDIIRFGIQSQRSDSKLLHQAMTGSADRLVWAADQNNLAVKLGFIASSTLFDPESINSHYRNVEFVKYIGDKFDRAHATGDNVIAHALMAKHGFDLTY